MRAITIAAPETLPTTTPTFSETFTITTTTPMTGGGYEAGKIDPSCPIRVPSIRGNLRYWLRLLGLDGEAEIFGNTKHAGRLSAEILNTSPVQVVPCNYRQNDPEGYALFPVIQNEDSIAKEGLTFTLQLTYPEEFREKVRLAVSAWVYFGGIGTRTRRGCGSLSCEEVCSIDEVLAHNEHITLWTKLARDGLAAWRAVLKLYREYRSEKVIVSVSNPKPHGKSGRISIPLITKALHAGGKWYSAVIVLPHYDAFNHKDLESNGFVRGLTR